MNVIYGTEGGSERVILVVALSWWRAGFYLAVRPRARYYRLALGWPFGIYVGRS
jgi:hypothetical protein